MRAQAEQLEKYHVLLRELKPAVGWGEGCSEPGMPCAQCCMWGSGGESCLEGDPGLTGLSGR